MPQDRPFLKKRRSGKKHARGDPKHPARATPQKACISYLDCFIRHRVRDAILEAVHETRHGGCVVEGRPSWFSPRPAISKITDARARMWNRERAVRGLDQRNASQGK